VDGNYKTVWLNRESVAGFSTWFFHLVFPPGFSTKERLQAMLDEVDWGAFRSQPTLRLAAIFV